MLERQKRNLLLNTVISLGYQITVIICGFVLPHEILEAYGSEVNGLVNSITQFLGVISFLELGVGAVVKSALYKPLALNDNESISNIISSASRFFKMIAMILVGYLFILIILFPKFVDSDFTRIYIDTLLFIIALNFFAQYYYGIVDNLLLTADQKGYLVYLSQTGMVLSNTIICIVLIKAGYGIHVIKSVTAILYIVRPLVVRLYINKNYKINRHSTYEEEPIKQKWNGISQHIAYVLLDGSDIVILTIFSSLSLVSIYSVYNMVVFGVKQVFTSATGGVQAFLGNLWARDDRVSLNKYYHWTEWIIHTVVIFVFGCTSVLIVPFVKVYTINIKDVDYIQPLFALLITMAHALHCLRLPYNDMILAANKYKETQISYIFAAILNIVISVITVKWLGLIGVAIGTLVSMGIQTVWMAYYCSKQLIHSEMNIFIKQILVDVLSFSACVLIGVLLKVDSCSYREWVLSGIEVFFINAIVCVCVNILFYKDRMIFVSQIIRKKIKTT